MRILLTTAHRYPAWAQQGAGRHPLELPSASAYHLHDLLARGLAEEGHEVLYRAAGGVFAPPPFGVQFVSTLPTDIHICHTIAGPPGAAEELLAFSGRHGKPCLLTCHMLRPGTAAASNWVFVSHAHAAEYGSARVVTNGIDPGDYIFSETKSDYLLFMAAMNKAHDKGIDLALELSRRKGFRLIVAGTGQDVETIRHIEELCDEAGAEYRGDVRGRERAELLAGARAVLFPSKLKEGCPLVILQAMLSGTPVISSRCGGSVDIVTPETGFLCSEPEEWDRAVDAIGSISPRRCREIGMERYHYRRMARDYVREYAREIARQG
jgi:glycosyltransferase involved in cell wall biosynthesis